MKNTNMRWRLSINKRLIIAFIVATFPIYLFAGILYNWTSDLLRKDIMNSTETQSQKYLSELNSTLNRFNSLQYDMLNDGYVIQFANAYDTLESYHKIQLIHFLRSKLISIRNSSDFIMDVRLYLTKLDIEISANDGYGQLKVIDIPPAKLKDPYHLITYNDRLLSVAYPLESEYITTPEMIVEIEMRTSELHRSFEAALEKEYSGAIVLGLGRNVKNMTVVNDDKLELSITRHYREMKQSIQEASPIQTNKDYIFVRSSLAENDLYIDHYLYTPTMFEPISKSIVWFWLFFGLTILMVALYLYYINRIINKPIVKLVRAFKRIEEGNLELNIQHNKEDEFGYLYEHRSCAFHGSAC